MLYYLRNYLFATLFLLTTITSGLAQAVVTIDEQKDACNGLFNGSIRITVVSGVENLSYFVFGLNFGQAVSGPLDVGVPVTVSGLRPDNYVLAVDDGDPAGNFNTALVIGAVSGVTASIDPGFPINNSSCITPNGQISITASGGSGSYSYSWDGPGSFTATTDDITGLPGGTYEVTVTDLGTNCTFQLTPILLTDPSPAVFNVVPPLAKNVCAGDPLTIALAGSESTVSYEVLKNGNPTGVVQIGNGGPLLFVVPSGTFSTSDIFTILATNGFCTPASMNGVVNVTIVPLPTASISGTTAICFGGTTALTFTLPAGTYDVVYTDGTTNFNANGIVNGATVNVSPVANTTYTIVSVTNTATLCSVTAPSPNITGSAVITVNPLPIASISGTTTICTGGITALTFTLPAGTYNVVYTDGTTNFNANGIVNGATVNVSPAVNTTYTIVSVSNTVTLCSVTAPSPNITGSAVVTVNPLPTASISGTTTICSGNNATLTFTLSAGTYDVVYTDGTTNFTANGIVNGATVSVSPGASTTYTIVSITNTTIASCTVTAPSPNITGSAIVTVNPSPTASISGTSAICLGGNAVLTFTLPAVGTFDVVYTDGTTNFNATGIINGATVNVSPGVNTTYTIVSVTNTATSCAVTAPSPNITGSAIITVNPLPTASISGTIAICTGDLTPLTFTLPAGTFNVVYTDGTTNFNANGIVNGATVNVSPAANTTYTIVSVTDVATTCIVTAPSPNITGSAIITVNPLPTASISGTAAICTGASTTLTFTLPAGTYDVVYTDGTTNFNATGIVNGATVNVSPTANTTYTIVSVTNTATTCSVTAPSANITGSAIITVSPLPTASISGTTAICTGDATPLTFTLPAGTYDVVYTDGTTNFNATGIVNGATVNVSPAANTTYTIVSVTNTVTLCSVSAPSPNITGSAIITVSPLPTASISGTNTICAGASTVLTFTLPAGTYNVVYSDGTTNFNANGIVNGATVNVSPVANATYTIVSVTNTVTSCTVTAPSPNITGSAIITVNPLPTASISGTTTICIGGTTALTFTLSAGTFDVVYTDGTTNFNANGIVSGATVNVSPTANTTYTIVSVTNTATTCSVTAPSANITGTAIITVDPLPTASISGTATICSGNSTALTFTLPAGTYNVVYTDGTTNFNANGISSGATVNVNPAANTTYTIVSVTNTVTLCSVTAPSPNITGSAVITVNPSPTASISGTITICSGTNATLTFTLSAGTHNVVYTDGTTNFNANGISSGATVSVSPTANTTYTIVSVTNGVTSCAVTAPSPNITGSAVITVTPTSTATLSGTTTICAGSPASLTINFTGTGPYTFSFSDGTTTSAVIPWPLNSITFPVSPATTSTYTLVTFDDLGSACPETISGSAVITVNQNPQTNLAVGVTLDPLCSGGISDVTVTASELGVSYQLRNEADNSLIGAPVIGTGGVINLSTGVLVATTTFNVLATATGCTPVELTNQATVNVSGAINAGLAVTAATNPLCAGNSTDIQITSSENGVLYQLRNDLDNSLIGVAVAGTGGTINLPTGVLAATTDFNVLATNGACSIELTDIETVTVSPSPDASLAVAVTLEPLCVGGSTTITVALSQVGISYQLRDDSDDSPVGVPVVGTGATISLPTGVLNVTTIFNVLATGVGCPAVELTAQATVNVSGIVDASLTTVAGASPICEGTGTDIQIANSEVGVDYQLRDDATDTPVGTPVTGTGLTILLPTGNLAATTTFNVLATNGACSIELTDLETVNVDVAPDPALAVSVTLDPLCVGGTSAVTVALSQVGVGYQLRNDADDSAVGGIVVGTGGTINLPTGVLNATTVFNVLASSGVCTPVELTALATVNVAGTLDATLTVSSSASPICAGSSTFIQVLASEVGVDYQLRDDLTDTNIGVPVAGTGGTINLPTGNLSITTTFNVVANNGTCSIELTDLETVIISASPDLTLSVTAASALICSGASSNIIVTASQIGVSYQLRNNAGNVLVGVAVAGTGGNILLPTGNLAANTTFNVLATVGTCSAQLTATATVAIRPLGDPACGGGGSDCTNFSSIQPTIVTQPSCNDRDAGEVSFTIARTDGTPTTFRVIWTINGTNQTKFTSGTVAFDDLSSGLISVYGNR